MPFNWKMLIIINPFSGISGIHSRFVHVPTFCILENLRLSVHCLLYPIIYLDSLTAFVSAKIPHHMELTQHPGCSNNECCTCRHGNWILILKGLILENNFYALILHRSGTDLPCGVMSRCVFCTVLRFVQFCDSADMKWLYARILLDHWYMYAILLFMLADLNSFPWYEAL